jgi:hypothetical protein
MAELDAELPVPEERRWRFDWLLPTFFRPARTMGNAARAEKPVWLLPLLIVSLLIIASVLAAGPIRAQAAQSGAVLPPDYQYWSVEQQNQYQAAQQNASSPLFIYVFPALGKLLGLWTGWLLTSILLHLGLTIAGSNATQLRAFNLAGWAALPLGLRHLVQAAAAIAASTVVANPGLSGFISSDAEGFKAFLRALAALVDLYWMWQLLLLLLGSVPLSGLRRVKAWLVTLLVAAIVLLLSGLPGYLASSLSGLKLTGGFFF